MSKFVVFLLLICLIEMTEAVTGFTCQSHSDCGNKECCFNPRFIMSRREAPEDQRFIGPLNGTGTCQAKSAEGESCDINTSCGCARRLRCIFKPDQQQPLVDSSDSSRIIRPGPSGVSVCTARGKKHGKEGQ